MTNKELISKIREEILHLKMKELQRTNGINTGADVYLSSYAVLSILSNALTEESEDERIRKKLYNTVMGTPNDSTWFDGTSKEAMLAWLEKQKEQKPAEWSEEQMEALAYASQVLGSDLSPRAAKASEELESLREQLKRLMQL